MNQSEVKEIRGRLKAGENAIYSIYGCYVNANKEIISTFEASPGLMALEEEEMFFKLFKRVLSGSLEKNLLDIEFTVEQVESSSEHKLLMDIKNSAPESRENIEELCKKIIDSFTLDDKNYLILIAKDAYDVSYKDKNDEEVFDGGGEVFNYFLCAVCPVKDPKPELKYIREDGKFGSSNTGQIAQNPELGFMFPVFNDRSSDIYHALYYTRDQAAIHEEVIDAVFKSSIPVSAPQQKVVFEEALLEAAGNELSLEVVQVLNEKMREKIEMHKEIKDPEPLALSVTETKDLLSESGIKDEKIERFGELYEKASANGIVRPENIVDTKKFEIKTPEVQIKVSPEASYLIETRVIDGRKYVVIPADTGIEVNGIDINIALE